jgi:lantibiotic leader peptide-processing serine protease
MMSKRLRIAATALVAVAVMLLLAGRVTPARAGTMQTYLVLYREAAVPADATSVIARAGGTLVSSYGAIGVAIARSDSTSFRSALLKDSRVENASATAAFASRLSPELPAVAAGERAVPANSPAPGSDTLSELQWDMDQIKAPQARAVTGGNRSVVVGIIDTGIDYTHPDLAPNIDFANSVSCVGGVPNQAPAAWADDNGHGTHTAGTVAAAKNGLGIVGVAPNVRLAAIKTGNAEGYFFPEAVVCAFMWAGSHNIAVTNNSYFADPWLYNCRNDATQRAIWKAEQRAIRYAMSRGVTVVSSAGNENKDLAHTATDTVSPNFPPGSEQEREVTAACLVVPAEIPGVITVSANGNLQQKSYYSSYGQGVVDVVAPGGDARFQMTTAAPNGRVLSTYPAAFFNPASSLMVQDCSVSPCAVYAYLQGTSMASPHVAGVAALIVSQYGGSLSPGRVAAIISNTADPIPCPPNPFNPGPPFNFAATCQGGAGHNSFYGAGQVNALSALRR